ncbi:hypothetical protein AERO8C_20416 [Aeromonas veronii]|uniref:Uncharacterized protein n=1 Tax=Aeromonas veronii TaxID=654 RepID=A0A653L0Z2_AERVE|nr:hypothetical protein AERO8C_20416 [Aeromonas veronii]
MGSQTGPLLPAAGALLATISIKNAALLPAPRPLSLFAICYLAVICLTGSSVLAVPTR